MPPQKNRNPKSKDYMQDRSAVKHTAGLSQFNDSTDCFGKEYDNTTTECRYCASNEICALWQIKTNKLKAETIQPITGDRKGFYLGDARPEQLNKKTMLELVKAPMPVSELIEALRVKAQLDDVSVIMAFLKEFKRNNPSFVQYEVEQDGETDYYVKFL